MNLKKVIIASLILTGLGTVNAMANTGNPTVSTSYLQSGIKINGAIKKGYIGNKGSQVGVGVSGNHTVYEAHDGYIK